MIRFLLWYVLAITLATEVCVAEPIGGWRGNGNGVWKGNPPLSWRRVPKGALEGLRAQIDPPKTDQPDDAALVEKGQIRQWLAIGPFAVADSAKDFDRDALGGE